MADKKSKSQPVDLGDAAESQPSLGHVISEARERKGLTRDQVANETHVPMYYIKMIETDSYDQIADRLYLVPFIRRYASSWVSTPRKSPRASSATCSMPRRTSCESRRRSRW